MVLMLPQYNDMPSGLDSTVNSILSALAPKNVLLFEAC